MEIDEGNPTGSDEYEEEKKQHEVITAQMLGDITSKNDIAGTAY